ncbi:MAG: FAD-dependent oxidoreductase [Candidatus Babeliales bacterium]
MAHVVILGAGLTGLSAAYHLEKRGFTDFRIFEKEGEAGGLCRSIEQDGFTFDYTGHLLHINDSYFKEFIQQTIGLNALTSIDRRSYIYSHDVYTQYPFQTNLHGLPAAVITACIAGYLKRKKRNKTEKNFIDWAYEQFGAGIANSFFIPYQKKIFAYNLRAITPSWTGRFVPSTSLQQIIEGAVAREISSVGYNAHFYYPTRGGIQAWLRAIQACIQTPIHTSFTVRSVDLRHRVVCFENGHEEPFTHLINTLPLDTFLSLLRETPDSHMAIAIDQLACNSVVNFNIGVSGRSLSDKHWIYFPEKQFPFYRIGFPHNFSVDTVPAGCSSLYGEFAHMQLPAHKIAHVLRSSTDAAKKLLHINAHDIATEKTIYIRHAYVIYNFWREKYLPRLLQSLQNYGIISTGRYGAWKYASMQESVLDGKLAAENVTIMPAVHAEKRIAPTPHTIKEHQL